jgi:L-ribulose-5-phosphate 4-epimerase
MAGGEIADAYEENMGHVMVRALHGTDPAAIPGILVANHGPFSWGRDPAAAAHKAAILESLARMAYFTITLNQEAQPIDGGAHDKHYMRKHGKNAYYGRRRKENESEHGGLRHHAAG